MNRLDLPAPEPKVLPGRKVDGVVAGCLIANGAGFRTTPVEVLALDFEGAIDDGHRGFTRLSGSREPWFERGTPIRSGRQLSIVSEEELAEVAAALDIAAVDPGLIGANLVVAGIPRFSYLPAGTRLFLGEAVVVVEAMNGPCRFAGRALADAHPGRDDIELGFVPAAKRRRGVVASVERVGTVTVASRISVRIPEQWIWTG